MAISAKSTLINSGYSFVFWWPHSPQLEALVPRKCCVLFPPTNAACPFTFLCFSTWCSGCNDHFPLSSPFLG